MYDEMRDVMNQDALEEIAAMKKKQKQESIAGLEKRLRFFRRRLDRLMRFEPETSPASSQTQD